MHEIISLAFSYNWQNLLFCFDNNFWFWCERSHVGGISMLCLPMIQMLVSCVQTLSANEAFNLPDQKYRRNQRWPAHFGLPETFRCLPGARWLCRNQFDTPVAHLATMPRSLCNVSATRACGVSTESHRFIWGASKLVMIGLGLLRRRGQKHVKTNKDNTNC